MAGKRGCGPHRGHCAGEANHRAKIRWKDAREMRRAYGAREATQKQLAARFNISKSSVHCIVTEQTWKE